MVNSILHLHGLFEPSPGAVRVGYGNSGTGKAMVLVLDFDPKSMLRACILQISGFTRGGLTGGSFSRTRDSDIFV